MKITTQLKILVEELNRIHQADEPWSECDSLPDFVTAENGVHRYFTQKAISALWVFQIFYFKIGLKPRIELKLKDTKELFDRLWRTCMPRKLSWNSTKVIVAK